MANNLPPVLDVCCSAKMMWFNKDDERALFMDVRRETIKTDSRQGRSDYVISPDFLGDFTKLPFPDNTFHHVVFDPPHILRKEAKGWITRKYGVLNGNWKTMIAAGFSECFRVLKQNGTLVFKWSDSNISISEILKLTPEKPLYGHKSGKQSQTHWVAFLKTHLTQRAPAPKRVTQAVSPLPCYERKLK